MKVLVERNKPTSDFYRKKTGVARQAQWSQRQKMDAVKAFACTGNVMRVVEATGIPEETIRKWKTAQWWKDSLDELRKSSKLQLSGKLSEVIQKTVVALEDRVVNGDFMWDFKTKEWIRKPITAAVANRITNDLVDKTLVLEKSATYERESDQGLEDRLKKLKDEMIKFAKTKTIEGEVIVDVVSVQPSVP